MSVFVPSAVEPPATVHVVHAAGRTDSDALAAGIEQLTGFGFEVRHDAALGRFDPDTGGLAGRMRAHAGRSLEFLAGPDVLRARAVVDAITDPTVDALIAARGGYGAMRIVERLPTGLLADHPKWLAGYSDITALHLWAYAQGIASLHGPMVASLPRHGDDGSLAALVSAMAHHPTTLPARAVAWEGTFAGPMIGGNLSLLAAMRPSRWWPALDGVVLFIEEIGEPLYRIDRMLQTLRLAGGLDRVAGFVIGQLTGCGREPDRDDAESEARALELVVEKLAVYRKPIVAGVPSGHGTPNATFVHGAPYRFADGRLVHVPGAAGRARHGPRERTLGWVLAEAISAGVTPAAQLHVSQGAEVVVEHAVGFTAWTDDAARAAVTPTTLFDIASVTKAIGTAVLAHRAVADGLIGLDDRCPDTYSVATPTLRDLLRHTSGLPAYERVWEEARAAPDPRRYAEGRFAAIEATTAPGKDEAYSDVGYVALGRWLEAELGDPFGVLFERLVAAPLGIDDECAFGVSTNSASGVAATEVCSYRDATLQGTVHDENCQALGGVAGHAGVFSTARALGVIGRSLLGFGPSILPPDAVERMWSVDERLGTYTLGWDTPSGPRSNAGSIVERSATVGHLGFTGCSLWIDRSRDVVIVLMTNRVHPTRTNAGIRWLRPALHDAVMRELGYGDDT